MARERDMNIVKRWAQKTRKVTKKKDGRKEVKDSE